MRFGISTITSLLAILLTLTARWFGPQGFPNSGMAKDPLATPAHIPFWTLETQLLAVATMLVMLAAILIVVGLFRQGRKNGLIPAAIATFVAGIAVAAAWFVNFMGYT